jgi:hypothetical protein
MVVVGVGMVRPALHQVPEPAHTALGHRGKVEVGEAGLVVGPELVDRDEDDQARAGRERFGTEDRAEKAQRDEGEEGKTERTDHGASQDS